MARQVSLHLGAALSRQRISLRAGSVYLYGRNGVGHTGVDLCDGTFATVPTLREVNHSFSGLRGRRPTQISWSGPAVYAISRLAIGNDRRPQRSTEIDRRCVPAAAEYLERPSSFEIGWLVCPSTNYRLLGACGGQALRLDQ